MLLPHGVVIALVDGQNFRLLRNAGTEAAPQLIEMEAPTIDSRNHSGAGHRSSPGNHADALVAEDAHAMAVTAWLNGEVLERRIEYIVVIAAPRTLGEMRHHYHKVTERALLREMAKDMADAREPEIIAALKG